jgi:hypothetical protein
MRFICENCYFSKINQSQNTNENELPFTLLYTSASINFISFKNTTFEDINISKLPLIDSNGLILEIEDSRFSNCVTDNGYLISIKQQYNNQYVKIKNFPTIASSKYTKFVIENTELSSSFTLI